MLVLALVRIPAARYDYCGAEMLTQFLFFYRYQADFFCLFLTIGNCTFAIINSFIMRKTCDLCWVLYPASNHPCISVWYSMQSVFLNCLGSDPETDQFYTRYYYNMMEVTCYTPTHLALNADTRSSYSITDRGLQYITQCVWLFFFGTGLFDLSTFSTVFCSAFLIHMISTLNHMLWVTSHE